MKKTVCYLLLYSTALFLPLYSKSEEPRSETSSQLQEQKLSIPSIPIAPQPYFEDKEELKNELFKDESDNSSRFFQEFLNMLSILAIMVTVLLLATWFMKRLVANRMQQGNTSSSIKILERRGLTAKTAIYLIEIDEHRIAIAESSNGATLLFHTNSPPGHIL